MRRCFFVASALSAMCVRPRAARATGGLDVGVAAAPHVIRVLLASGAFAIPQAIDAWHFAWNDGTYRGTFSTIPLPDGRSGLLNTLPLDAYLAGVMSKEMPPSWPEAAQQAQAIVSRTYVLGRLRPEKPYDVGASEADQVYAGIEGETILGRAAIDATSGMLVVYSGLPAQVAYSACCGGRTADAASVWNKPFPYLPSIVDPYCIGTPAYAWRAEIPCDTLARAFGSPYDAIGTLQAVALEVTAPQERPNGIAFIGTSSRFETTPKMFRAAMGPSVIRSTFVRAATVESGGTVLDVSGTGHGHGVGLCQWGARMMAAQGASAEAILAFYFPGTLLGRG